MLGSAGTSHMRFEYFFVLSVDTNHNVCTTLLYTYISHSRIGSSYSANICRIFRTNIRIQILAFVPTQDSAHKTSIEVYYSWFQLNPAQCIYGGNNRSACSLKVLAVNLNLKKRYTLVGDSLIYLPCSAVGVPQCGRVCLSVGVCVPVRECVPLYVICVIFVERIFESKF